MALKIAAGKGKGKKATSSSSEAAALPVFSAKEKARSKDDVPLAQHRIRSRPESSVSAEVTDPTLVFVAEIVIVLGSAAEAEVDKPQRLLYQLALLLRPKFKL
ncbi:uncharacterized protein A4U43_C01F14850 [Asparagus officinalis]|uniref:Uncharacterized protein n=1 Tax=Asparagus officinalis TaxID=4686 RepID=A0A5P1FPE3_ASPOF|nr:uncharacterized protein A4U43_C01F14850 [Asparagus officinalis]